MNAPDPLDRFVADLHDPDGPALSAVRSLLAEAGATEPVRAALGTDSAAGATADAATGADPRLEHLRYKPGHSVLARVTGHGQPWWLVVRSPRSADKAAKIRARAAESGFPLLDAEVPGSGLHLQAGPVGLDKHLHKPLRRGGLVDARGAVAGTVLSYNPWRRLVLRRVAPGAPGASAPEAPTVLRVWHTAPASADLVSPLHAAGVSVLPARRTRVGIEQPWVAGGDLERLLAAEASGRAPTRALDRTAEAVAGLHAALDTVPGLREAGLSRVDPAGAVVAARDGLEAVMPDLLPAFDRVGEEVRRVLAADRSRDVLLHGDLSADQVVLDTRGAVRLIDLDRLAIGPAGYDLGGFAAVELIRGRAGTAEALVAAYRERAAAVDGTAVRAAEPGDAAVRAWTAHHLLLRVAEPFRALAPAWREQIGARIRQALAVLEGDPVGADA
ncbi:aminoglycoside phosphotransferase family protein [Brevibacterium senegalense]|uniref:aminoglycoside phosphotransferase family protein n=1 Tax=Brevibacterium senegalense TaxID=1033736 RepID=UPI00030CD30D|nr:aminoglycoside phosphotransferase family protein [Brevibacterium senegalense]